MRDLLSAREHTSVAQVELRILLCNATKWQPDRRRGLVVAGTRGRLEGNGNSVLCITVFAYY